MKILAFAASNSSASINKKLVTSVVKYFKETVDEIRIIDLNDFEMPLFSQDIQNNKGIPQRAYSFMEVIDWADFIIISFAEHNGNYSVAYKNIIDWVSRIAPGNIFKNKPIFMMATSNGKRGGQSALDIAKNRMPFDKGNVIDTFSLPEFSVNFEDGKGVTNILHRSTLESKVRKIKRTLSDMQNNNSSSKGL